MKKRIALFLAVMMLVPLFAACGEQEEAPVVTDPVEEVVPDTEAVTEEPVTEKEVVTEAPKTEKVETTTKEEEPKPTYDENYKIAIFGDGTLANVAELITGLANAANIGITIYPANDDGTTATKKCCIYDTSDMEKEKASSYNLYEVYTFTDSNGETTRQYDDPAATLTEKDSGTAARFFPTLWEGGVDYYIMETGRDRNLFAGLPYGAGSKRVLERVIKDYYGEGSTNGSIILYAPAAYLDGSVAFNLTTKIVSDGEEDTFINRTGGISTNAAHIEAIKAYADELADAAGKVGEVVYMCDAFAGYSDPASLYTEWGATPSDAGRYYEACVFFAQITCKSPVGNAFIGELDADTAAALQKAAAEFVLGE